MEEITRDVISQTESELKLPPSPKRPRTDCTISNGHSGESRFHFPELLTFQGACVTPSLTIPSSAGVECTAERGNDKYPKTDKQLQPIVIPMNKITLPHNDDANRGPSNACFIIPERNVLLVKDEQPPANETDKLSSYPPDDAGEASEESHTSKDARADSSSQPDCDCLGKSLEDEPPGGRNLPAGDGGDGRQVQNSVSQIKAFNFSSSDEEVRCLSDFTCEGTLCDAGFCYTCSQYAEDELCDQRSSKDGFSENILLDENEIDSLLSSVVHMDSELFYPIPEEDPHRSLAEGVKSEAEIIKMQLCGEEDFNVQVCQKGMSENSIPSAAEWAEESIVSFDTVLVQNIGTENASLEADDFCWAKGAHAASKMIAKTGSEMADHTTGTPVPARISQEPAGGDNDAGPFGVIDPAICSESNKEAEEKGCGSGSAAGAELSPFVKTCEQDMPLCPDAQPPQEDSASVHSRTHLCEDEKDFCQSDTEPQTCHLLSEFARMDGATQKEERETTLDVESNEREKLECSIDLEEKRRGLENCRKDTTEMSIDDFLNEWVDEKIGNCGNTLTQNKEESESNLERSSDHSYSYSVATPTMEETPEESERKEAEDVQVNGSSEMLVKLIDCEVKRDVTEVSPDEYISEHSEAIKSQSGDKLLLNSQQEQSIESVYLNRPETDDPLTSTFPPTVHAVVPGPREFRHPQTADQNPAAFISSDRFSPLPSAKPFCVGVTGAFDTFEKIELSRDDDGDNDAGLSNSPLLTSRPEQLLEAPQPQLHPTPEAESSEREEASQEEDEEGKEEDVERFECHTDNTANGLSSRDYSCDELSNSAADVPSHCWPERKLDCESAFKSSEGFQGELKPPPVSWDVSSKSDSSAPDVNNEPQFEMRQQFDKVLKELNLFFEVSRSEFACCSGESSPEPCGDVAETWESDASGSKDLLIGCGKDPSSDDADEVLSLDVCGCDPVVSCPPGSGDGEQEVPLGSCQEVSVPTAEEHKEPQEMEPKRKTWSPSFMCQSFLEQLSYRPPEPNRRLEPLKTCTRPLRVGLSKKAKTKHLHRPHPYK